MSREQRRAEALSDIESNIRGWAALHGVYLDHAPINDLVVALFNQQPAYCPYDCSGCHDDECPCSNCSRGHTCSNRYGPGCQAPAYPCSDDCPDQGDD